MDNLKKSVVDDGDVPTARLETLVDGVFAIAMTLLVLDIRVPEGASGSARGLLGQVAWLWPNILSFIVSFVILGMFWVAHHTEFRFIKKLDNKLIWQNLFYLLLVALLPFSAALLGRYPHNQTAVIIYALHLIFMVLLHYFMWWHGRRAVGIMEDAIDPRMDRLVNRVAFVGIIAYVFAIILSFFNVNISLVIYAIIPLPYIFGWIYRLA